MIIRRITAGRCHAILGQDKRTSITFCFSLSLFFFCLFLKSADSYRCENDNFVEEMCSLSRFPETRPLARGRRAEGEAARTSAFLKGPFLSKSDRSPAPITLGYNGSFCVCVCVRLQYRPYGACKAIGQDQQVIKPFCDNFCKKIGCSPEALPGAEIIRAFGSRWASKCCLYKLTYLVRLSYTLAYDLWGNFCRLGFPNKIKTNIFTK